LALKANASDVEASLELKANASDVYTKDDTDKAIAAAIADMDHLSREVVEVLPDIEDADPNTIYMTPSGL
jgi:copper chaperone CopZ